MCNMVFNNRLNKIENVELEQDISNHLRQAGSFLIKLSPERNTKSIIDRISRIGVVVLKNDERIASRRLNGKIQEFEANENAFVTAGNVTTNNETTYVDSYIYLRTKANSHQKRHESIHALTTINEAEKVENNIYAFKTGVRRGFYKTTTGNLLEGEEFYKDGAYLDEGLTDYMAYLSENEGIEGSPYIQNVLLAAFLIGGDIGPNNNLIQAFTSDSVQDIKKFENDFDSYS